MELSFSCGFPSNVAKGISVPLFQVNRRPTDRQLRQFGVICTIAVPLVAWLWGGGAVAIGVCLAGGLVFAAIGYIAPQWLRPTFVGLSYLTIPIGLVVGELTLILTYFGMFLPLGVVFRLIGRDALELTWDRSAATYWRARKQPENVARYYRQT